MDIIAPLKILYKMPGISSKNHKLVIKYSLANSVHDRIEYMHARVQINNFTMFTVVNLILRVGDHVSP